MLISASSAANRLVRHLVTTMALVLPAALAAAPDPQTLLETADAIRFPQEPFQVSVTVDSFEGGGDAKRFEYRVLQRGNDKSIVQTLAPASERGQVMLSRDGDLWVFLPSVSQPIRLPMAQRLTGQVANGDLARANFAGDYTAELSGEEVIDDVRCFVLELTAARDNVTYQRVRYWVRTENSYPHKAEFYTVSGRLMKTARYGAFTDVGGTVRPMETVFTDAQHPEERSVMRYDAFRVRDIPEKIFTKQYLKKLR